MSNQSFAIGGIRGSINLNTTESMSYRLMLFGCIATILLFAVRLAGAQSTAPTTPPAQICGNSSILYGPTTAPNGATIVPAGDNSGVDLTAAGATYYFQTGTHTFGSIQFDAIVPGNNSTFIGAPGAVLDGQSFTRYAFAGSATGVTIEYLTIQHFGTPPVLVNGQYTGGNLNQNVVNESPGDNWTVKYNTIANNHGEGVNAGDHGTVSYNCIDSNGQEGVSTYKALSGNLVYGPGPSPVNNVIIDHNEISNNDTDDWETKVGCGCSGGIKLWNSNGVMVTNNWVHDNKYVALWADTQNVNISFIGNYVANNFAEAIFIEISYNSVIQYNTLVGNGFGQGPSFTGSFPDGMIYISESGGDANVSQTNTTLDISHNVLTDNWGGVSLWENPDRFCNNYQTSDPNYNSPSNLCTKLISAASGNCVSGTINSAPYYTDCRWHTQNVSIHDNIFSFNPADFPSNLQNCVPSCGVSALFSKFGSFPSWTPYVGGVVDDAITFNQNNHWLNNQYNGPWNFKVHDQNASGTLVDFATWQAAPYGQDVGSTFNNTSTTPNISSLSPTSGGVGTSVTITGRNFGATQGSSTVVFNGTAATPTSWSNTSIVVPVPAAATPRGVVLVTVGGVSSNVVSFIVAPSINSLSATSGAVGASVTITGTNFGSIQLSSTVTFNGVVATPTSWSDTSIVVPVPVGATTGNVVVTVAGVASNGVSFTVTSASILGLTPALGSAGTPVTITGANFGATQGTTTVTFNGTIATPTSWSNTSIVVPVPVGATNGNVVVTLAGVPSNGVFFITSDSITSLSPASGVVGAPVTITGTNFGATQGSSTVSFNGTIATPTSWSDTSIVVPVPSGTTSGNVVVTVAGVASNVANFTVIRTNYLDADTATLEGSIGQWTPWYGDTISQSTAAAHDGSFGLSISPTSTHWGVTLSNYPGFAASPGSATISFWAKAGSGSSGTGATLEVDWRNSSGVIRADTVSIPALTSTWTQTTANVVAPAGTTSALVSLSGVAPVGSVIYTDTFFVGTNDMTIIPPGITSLSPTFGPVGTPITITGTNFGATQGTSTVTFNGVAATPTSWSDTSIVVPVPSGATTGNVVVTVAGVASNGVTFTVGTPPIITSLSPTSGAVGTPVTITGTNFGATQGSSTVTFNGVAATPTSWSNTSIVVPVPVGTTSGNVVVTVAGVASNGVIFTLVPTAPGIFSLSPTSGVVGASVTITGTNFGATQGGSIVTFNGVAATPTSWSATSIVVLVPSGAITGNVVVTVGGVASNGVSFTVTSASILSLSPASGVVGASVTITGRNFGATQGSSTVTFNGSAATPTSWSDTSIVVPAPVGTTSGNVVVTVAGLASNGVNFTVTRMNYLDADTATLEGSIGQWTPWYGDTISQSTAAAHDGSFGLSISPTSTHWGVTLSNYPGFAASPGSATISFWAMAGSGSSGTGTTLEVDWRNSSGVIRADTVSIPALTSAWTQATANVVAPAGTTLVSVSLTGIAPVGSVIYADTFFVGTNDMTIIPPSITSLSPTSGAVGASVTITGTNFGATQGSSTVTFNGVAATPTSWSATSIVVPVPSGATTGNVVVTVAGNASNAATFTVTTPPSITSLSPTSGAVGASVTITGTHFGATQGSSTVTFNGVTATPASWSDTNIVVPVPIGATTGNVVVTSGGVASNGVSFTVTSASILGLTPRLGSAGTLVTITGTNFGATPGSSTVTFNGVIARPISWSATSIVVPVPVGATNGNVVVTVAGVPSNGVFFITSDSITILSPDSGIVGTSVTIIGTNFGAVQGSSTVSFNGTAATPTSWSDTSIVVPVPVGTISGNVVVTVAGVASNAVFFTVTNTNFLDADTATLEGSIGQWTSWYGDTISQSTAAAHDGIYGLSISTTGTHWGVTLKNYPGFAASPGNATISFWAKAGSGSSGTGATLEVDWRNSSGVIRADTVSIPALTSTWTQTTANVVAPAGTTLVSVSLYGIAPVGSVIYADTFFVGSNNIPPPPVVNSLSPSSGAVGTSVTINGVNFGATQGASTVSFNGVAATPTSWSDTSIVVQVPVGATTGNVVVTVDAAASNGVSFAVNYLDNYSATLEGGSIGHWRSWYGDTIARTTGAAHDGSYGLRILTTGTNWGVTMNNYPGFAASPGNATISFWSMAGSGSSGTGATLEVDWLGSSGVLQVDTVSIPALTSTWTLTTANVVAPAGTTSAFVNLYGQAPKDSVIYADTFFVGSR